MKRISFLILIVSLHFGVRADDFFTAVGKRTGLGRVISEVSGEAEANRTADARNEARKSEQEADQAQARLLERQRDLEKASTQLEELKQKAREEKARIRKSMLPIIGQLGTLSAQVVFLSATNSDMVNTNADLGQNLEHFQQTFAVILTASKQIPSVTLDEGRFNVAYKYVSKVSGSDEKTKEFGTMMNDLNQLLAWLDSADQKFLTQLLPGQSRSMNRDLTDLGAAIGQTVENVNRMSSAAHSANAVGGL